MYDYLLVILCLLAIVFFTLGFLKRGLAFYGLAGIILLGCGLFVMQDGLDIKNGFDLSNADEISYMYQSHSFVDSVEVQVTSYSLIAFGLTTVFSMFAGLRKR